MSATGASLIRPVSSCVYVQMVSTLWAGMMCVLQATYCKRNQAETTNQSHQSQKYTCAPGSPPRQVRDFSGDDVVAVWAAYHTRGVSQICQRDRNRLRLGRYYRLSLSAVGRCCYTNLCDWMDNDSSVLRRRCHRRWHPGWSQERKRIRCNCFSIGGRRC